MEEVIFLEYIMTTGVWPIFCEVLLLSTIVTLCRWRLLEPSVAIDIGCRSNSEHHVDHVQKHPLGRYDRKNRMPSDNIPSNSNGPAPQQRTSTTPAPPSRSRAEQENLLVTTTTRPLAHKEVCVFLKGESFRTGQKGSRVGTDLFQHLPGVGLHPGATRIRDEQRLASESVVQQLIVPLKKLGAEVVLLMDTIDNRAKEERRRGDPRSRRENLLRSFYGVDISKFVWRGPDGAPAVDDVASSPPAPPDTSTTAGPLNPVGGATRPPYWTDPLRTFFTEFADRYNCSAGLLWTRPDLIFKPAMGEALRSAGFSDDIPPGFSSPERYSFVHGKVLPLDLAKLLYLSPTWALSETIGMGSRGQGRWRVVDTFGWLPGWMLERVRKERGEKTALRGEAPIHSESELPREGLFRDHEALGFFSTTQKTFVENNVGWVALNSQHDSDSAADWNPFYRMAVRSSVQSSQDGDTPSRACEEKIANVGRGF